MLSKNPPKFKPHRRKTVSFSFPDWDFKLFGLLFFFLTSVALLFALISAGVFGSNQGVVGTDEVRDGSPSPTTSLKVSLDDVRSLGSKNAPVVVVKYSDFRCGYCGKFVSEVKGLLESEYIDSGKVRFIYKDFAVLGPDSVMAGAAGWCAHDQKKFWRFHDVLFDSRNNGNDYGAFLSDVARDSGLDVSRFESCLNSGSKDSLVHKSSSEASSNGFRGTPAFIVMKADGSVKETIGGFVSFSEFKRVVDSLMS